jgi:branched-chain amino acid transport system ATP-binding protein
VSAALSVTNLVVGYDPGVPIVNGASLSLSPGEIVAVLGPNGAGKSTLIKAIAGVAPVRAGAVRLGEEDITRQPAHLLVRHGLAFVPQTDNVFTRQSIEDNLKLAAGVLKTGERAGRIAEVYRLFPDLLRQRRLLAGRLSGGQRQMLAIARALIVGPRVLMLDEPSAGLSPKLVGIVFAKLAEIRAGGVSILLVEQNARAALAVADRGVVLVEGRNRHEGPAAELWGDPRIAELYLGGARAAPASEARR